MASDNCLVTNNNGEGNVFVGECNGGNDQNWVYKANGRIRNDESWGCLDVAGSSSAREGNVRIRDCNSDDSDQYWERVNWDGNYFQLLNRATGMYLDASGQDGAVDATVQLWDNDDGAD